MNVCVDHNPGHVVKEFWSSAFSPKVAARDLGRLIYLLAYQNCALRSCDPHICQRVGDTRCNQRRAGLGQICAHALVQWAVPLAPRTAAHTKPHTPHCTAPGWTGCVHRRVAPDLAATLDSPVSVGKPGLIGVCLANVICRVTNP